MNTFVFDLRELIYTFINFNTIVVTQCTKQKTVLTKLIIMKICMEGMVRIIYLMNIEKDTVVFE